jgi:glucan 1,3-beta-glucosidase
MISIEGFLTFLQFAGCKIIYFDAGTYIITSTITIPTGTQVVGELWTVIMGQGYSFADPYHPVPVIRVGERCSRGVLEISDMVFSTRGSGRFWVPFVQGN